MRLIHKRIFANRLSVSTCSAVIGRLATIASISSADQSRRFGMARDDSEMAPGSQSANRGPSISKANEGPFSHYGHACFPLVIMGMPASHLVSRDYVKIFFSPSPDANEQKQGGRRDNAGQ
jgi:hypothetical protein